MLTVIRKSYKKDKAIKADLVAFTLCTLYGNCVNQTVSVIIYFPSHQSVQQCVA